LKIGEVQGRAFLVGVHKIVMRVPYSRMAFGLLFVKSVLYVTAYNIYSTAAVMKECLLRGTN
jgi:hypothetical protein